MSTNKSDNSCLIYTAELKPLLDRNGYHQPINDFLPLIQESVVKEDQCLNAHDLWITQEQAEGSFGFRRTKLPGASLLVTPTEAPHVYDIADKMLQRSGLSAAPLIYIVHDSVFGHISSINLNNKVVIILLYDHFLAKMSDRELQTLIAGQFLEIATGLAVRWSRTAMALQWLQTGVLVSLSFWLYMHSRGPWWLGQLYDIGSLIAIGVGFWIVERSYRQIELLRLDNSIVALTQDRHAQISLLNKLFEYGMQQMQRSSEQLTVQLGSSDSLLKQLYVRFNIMRLQVLRFLLQHDWRRTPNEKERARRLTNKN